MTNSADEYRQWVGRTESVDDDMSPVHAAAAAAMLDDGETVTGTGGALPLLWQWFYFLPRAPQHTLDDDGHPPRGGFMPPIPFPRRMFAGARVTMHRPLEIGVPARREGVIRNVVLKSGRTGVLAFVTVGYTFVQRGVVCIDEEQDIVYREAGAPVNAPDVQPWAETPAHAITRIVHADSRLLFRFSALTFNAHRIHYDRDYASATEGYPGLVVHGPLTAILLLTMARAQSRRDMRTFQFRGLKPLFDTAPFRLVVTGDGTEFQMRAESPDGSIALEATAALT